jgi:hypothetical protein
MAGEDPREVEGRAMFVRGEYEGSLQIFSKLFAEKADPVYLRNIGRCYQMLRNPARAIAAFREYLRRDATITVEERAEVEGFIHEMEALAAEQSRAPPAAATAPSASPPAGAVFAGPPPAPHGEEKPLSRRWWFWTAIGAAVVGGTVTAIALSAGGSPSRPACPAGSVCPTN